MDISTEQYKAAISLSNLTMYDLPDLVWHIERSNHLEGQITPDVENVREVINDWAEFLDCEVTETKRDEYTTVQLKTNFGDYGTFIRIWGHADRA